MNILGALNSTTAKLIGMSEEHQQFFATGWKCPGCGARLVNAIGITMNLYGPDGRRLSVWAGGGRRAETAECPKCGHRWKVYGASSITPPSGIEVLEIVETERSEEFLGEDRRVIDNSKCSTSLTRRMSFSKEWSKSCHIDFEQTQSEGSALSIGAKDMIGLKLSSEEKMRRAYSVSQDTKETCTEEISCEVAAYKKLTIAVHWKRIWQHGFIHAAQNVTRLQIPFRVAVGMTFDQQQIDEELRQGFHLLPSKRPKNPFGT
jgi:hypothetical protein